MVVIINLIIIDHSRMIQAFRFIEISKYDDDGQLTTRGQLMQGSSTAPHYNLAHFGLNILCFWFMLITCLTLWITILVFQWDICIADVRGHGGRVVTLSPPTSEAGVRFPARPQVGKLVLLSYCLATNYRHHKIKHSYFSNGNTF